MIDSQLITMMNSWTDTGGPGGQLVTRAEIYNVFQGLIEQTTLTDLGTPINGKIAGVVGGQWAMIDPPSGSGSGLLVTGSKGPGKIPKVAANGNDVTWEDDLTSTPGAAGSLQAVMDAGFETNKGFYLNRTLTAPTLDGQAVTQIWFEFDNLAKTSESPPYQRVPFLISQKAVRQGGDAPTGKINETMMMGWNLAPGGGNYLANIPGIGLSFESNYRDAGQRLVEHHVFLLTPGNQQVRGASYTYRTADSVFDFYHTVGRFYLKLPDLANVQNERQYFVVSPSTNSVNMGIGTDMGGRDGSIKSVTFEAAFGSGGGFSINNAGLLVPEVYFQGFSVVNAPGLRMAALPGQVNTRLSCTTVGNTVFDLESDNIASLALSNRRWREAYFHNIGMKTKLSDPNTSDIIDGSFMVYKNTTSGQTRLWLNDGGVMKSVTLS